MGHEQKPLSVILPAALAFGGAFMANDWFAVDLGTLRRLAIPYPAALHAVPWLAAAVAWFAWLALGRRWPRGGGITAVAIFWACTAGALKWVDRQVERVPIKRDIAGSELPPLEARLGFEVTERGDAHGTALLVARQPGRAATLAAEVERMGLAVPPAGR